MSAGNSPAASVGDREIVAIRVFDAPRELVFDMFTDEKHIGEWWGPKGFTTTTEKMEVKPGGVWRFCMHGPDGRDYENNITYLVVDRPNKLAFKHGGAKDIEPVNHETTITFEDVGGKTKLTFRMRFVSPEARDFVTKTYGALNGLDQTLGRLEEKVISATSVCKPFIISRTFNAPRDVVWKAWTDRDALLQWFGPKGFKNTHASLDLRPGGLFHYGMQTPDGQTLWGKFVYREIVPRERLVWVNSFSDENGGLTRHPFSPNWPIELLSIATFVEEDGKTTVTVHWTPLNPSEVEQKTFDAGFASMNQGWGGTFERLFGYLTDSN